MIQKPTNVKQLLEKSLRELDDTLKIRYALLVENVEATENFRKEIAEMQKYRDELATHILKYEM